MIIFRLIVFLSFVLVSGHAFALQLPPPRPADNARTSPYVTKVFLGGGGPNSTGVNSYSPEIGDCGAPDSNGRYKVSTCSAANKDIKDQNKAMVNHYVVALMDMAEQLTAGMFQQMMVLGSFFDAKENLELQRDYTVLAARAHKDYHPSEQMCVFGSGVKSIATTEERGRYNRKAAGQILVDYYKNAFNSATSTGYAQDIKSRIADFKKTYCDPRDHNNQLWELCFGKAYDKDSPPSLPDASKPERFNKDIDYNRTFSDHLTLPVDFTNTEVTDSEKDLIALARNLYWPAAFNPAHRKYPNTQTYQAARAIMARTTLAHNSFLHIMGMKSESPQSSDGLVGRRGSDYLRAILKQFGNLDNQKIIDMYGDNPSYFAQMEILTKKIYQHPQFYTNLYDKPANIDRINTTLEALQLMQMRDRYDSQLRREMLNAALLEDSLRIEKNRVEAIIQTLNETVLE